VAKPKQTSDTEQVASVAGDPSDGEPAFPRDRLLGADGPAITGHPPYVIAGALHDDDTPEFTRAQIGERINDFLSRPVSQEG
jgi:hypothetical protein